MTLMMMTKQISAGLIEVPCASLFLLAVVCHTPY